MVLRSGSLFGEKKAAGPKGYRAYAIGDIHGCLDLLDDMLALIEADVGTRAPAKNVLVFLGDLIDRGPDSAQVVERLRQYHPDWARTVFLLGNHEEVMLRVLDGDVRLLAEWLQFGGAECIRSYGVDPAQIATRPAAEAISALQEAIPAEHVAFIRDFADTLSFGDYLFVHAGIRPGVPLSDQLQSDLRWIRHPFLTDTRDYGCVIVHGHTISSEIDEWPNRIGIDTGAYRTGVLTALAVEGTQRWFLQTGGAIGPPALAEQGSKGSDAPPADVDR